MSAFVGFKHNVSESELKKLIKHYANAKSRYFLRWAHRVSGIELQRINGSEFQLPEAFPSPEGQMFDHDREIRWKQQSHEFSVLILSTQAREPDFTAIAGDWETKKLNANAYPETETRFPQGIQARKVNIAQRCFIDAQTATVHFVALTGED